MMRRLLIAALFAATLAPVAQAATLRGNVVRVLDGDTIEVMQADAPVRVRFLNIDAPEKRQPFGTYAADQLKALIQNAPVTVTFDKTDRYGRTLGIVTNSAGQQINRELVRAGAAWVYTRYNKDKGLPAIELEARQAKRGLWQQPGAVAPWEFRHHKKAAQ